MVLLPYNKVVASSKKHTLIKTRVHKLYPISDRNGYTLFQTKTAKNHTLWRQADIQRQQQ